MRPLGVEIAHMLAARDVAHVFGIPGVHNIELYRGIEEAGLTHILARNETGAGFMADGYARARGKPGVAFVITGPGFLNAMNPIGQAYSDSSPMLVIATCLDETAARKGQLHQMRDQEGAGRGVADWSETATTAEAAYALIDRAFAEFQTDRPRPKILHIPVRVLGAPAPPPPPPVLGSLGAFRSMPQADVEALATALSQARRPLVILGGGAVSASLDDITDVLHYAGAASFVTYAARGLIPPDAPRFFGSLLARPGSADVIAKADCVLAIGTELAEVDMWRSDLGATVPLHRVDIDPVTLSAPNQIAFQADADETLAALAKALRRETPVTDWTVAEVQTHRRLWRTEVEANRRGISALCETVASALPDDVQIFSDMTQFAYAAKEIWDLPRPGMWHHPYGFGTLGFALPAAIGARASGSPVLAIAGDSGLQYTLPELGTAAELGLSLPILLWDNAALAEIRDAMVRAQIAPNAVTQMNPDWAALATAYRIGFAEPETHEALADTLRAAFAAKGPTLIRVTPTLGDAA